MPSPSETIPHWYGVSRVSKLMISMITIAITLSSGVKAGPLPPGVVGAIIDLGDFCSDSPKNSKARQSCCQKSCIENIPKMNANGEVGSKFQLHQDWLDACFAQCPKR
jgi:hypothetical protein